MPSLLEPGADPDISPELAAFYANGGLVRRNVFWILVMTIGWDASFMLTGPLMTLHLNACGATEQLFGLMGMGGSIFYSYMVMYFSWKSDRTATRFGRRIPYLFICAPGIILSTFFFPFFTTLWVLVALSIAQLFFNDIKSATIPLLNIDCIPRKQLARMHALISIVGSVAGFFIMRYGMGWAEHHPKLPFYICAIGATLTAGIAGFRIKEPPVQVRVDKERFKPWSTFKVGWADRREIFLMLGVGCIGGFACMSGAWIWLFANNVLGLSKADMGGALAWGILVQLVVAYPAGWLVDRFGSYIIILLYVLVTTVAFVVALFMNSAFWLAAHAMLMAVVGPLYPGIDIMVYRSAHPKDIGSITSTNSFLRGMIVGLSVGLSGFLIRQSGGNYRLAFIEGYVLMLLGLLFFAIHYHLKKRGGPGKTAQEPEAEAALTA